jgi:uncharacterized membrane protein
MKRLYIYFFRGLITILPVALTVYLLAIFLMWTESIAIAMVRPFIGDFYVPGMGLVLGILCIIGIGYLVSKRRVRQAFSIVERPFTSIPVIKSVYSSLKSFADYFSPGAKQGQGQQVVILRKPGDQMEIVGLITRHGTEGLPPGFLPGGRVAVYLPMGYMIGGYTVFVPTEWVQPIDMSVEEAMRSSLIAWMANRNGADTTSPTPEAQPASPMTTAAPTPTAAPDTEPGPR